MEKTNTIEAFTDLRVWQEGHKLVIKVYEVTKHFPKEEMFGLINQLRRAIVSVTSNIAEGFGRNSYKEKLQFWYMSLGSLTEVQNQLLIARDILYISTSEFDELAQQAVTVNKMTNGLIKSTKNLIRTS